MKLLNLFNMKIAIIQEWLVTVGGSDKVVKAIAKVGKISEKEGKILINKGKKMVE